MEGMRIWDNIKQPPATALKTIGAGRLKGKTDINPQWRYQAMTEQFGICGVGWKYEIERLWNENGADGQVFAFALIKLYTRNSDGECWGDPIPGIGGSMLVAKESAGLHSSDEAYKMAVTDALSVAMKMLGMAADIYAGLWDGSKYRDGSPQTPAGKKTESPKTGKSTELSPAQWKLMKDISFEKQSLDEKELIHMVEWLAQKENLPMRHYKIAKMIIEDFDNSFQKYNEFMSSADNEELPFPV